MVFDGAILSSLSDGARGRYVVQQLLQFPAELFNTIEYHDFFVWFKIIGQIPDSADDRTERNPPSRPRTSEARASPIAAHGYWPTDVAFLGVEFCGGFMDCAFEDVGGCKGVMHEVPALQLASHDSDVVQLGHIFGQPLDFQPVRAGRGRGERHLGVVDRPVVENQHDPRWAGRRAWARICVVSIERTRPLPGSRNSASRIVSEGSRARSRKTGVAAMEAVFSELFIGV